ncbi:MAG: FkbM family methyltransferase [Alphaproteobacteria bacterium]
MTIKDTVKKSAGDLARKLGYEIIPVSRIMPRDIGEHLKSLFRLLNISCVFDVGANTGQYKDFLRNEVDYQGLIVSFEPGRKAMKALRAKAKTDSSWLIYECALAAQNGVKRLNVMKADDLSSFLSPDSSSTDLFAHCNVVDHTEDVQVRTLDSVLSELRMQRHVGERFYLKMDTQGYDLEVLRGADRSLSEISAIQTELSCLRLYKGMPGYVEILNMLDRRGYQLSGLFPVTQDTLLRVIEADCVMISRAQINTDDLRLMWTRAV